MITESSASKVKVKGANSGEEFYLKDCPILNSAIDKLNSNRTKFYLEINNENKSKRTLSSLLKIFCIPSLALFNNSPPILNIFE